MIKILIIKLGYSETLDNEISKVVSLGDVLRTTPILEALKTKYPQSKITFLTDEKAKELVQNNPYIDKIITNTNLNTQFDIVINFEKSQQFISLTKKLNPTEIFGFYEDSNNSLNKYIENKTFKKDYWQKILIEHLGLTWKKQKYSLGYKPTSKEKFDIGLNYMVGSKWPTKAMSKKKWEELYDKLTSLGFKVSWQQGLNNLYEYIDWIHSCKIIISQDSLGLHLAMALDKKLIGIFGSTGFEEIYPYNNAKFLTSNSKCPKIPCYSQKCDYSKFCMDTISIDTIIKEIKNLKG